MKRRTESRLIAAVVAAAASAVAALLATTTGASASTITLNPSKDNTLFEDGTGSLSNGVGSGIFTGVTASGLRRRGLFAFNLASANLPTNAQASSVTLALSVTMAAESPAPLYLRRALKNWGEGTSNSDGMMGGGGGAPSQTGDATWTHTFYNTSFWTSPGGDFSSVLSASANMFAGSTTIIGSTAQMVSDVQGWLNNPATNFGWETIGDEANFQTAMRIASREYSDNTSLRPLLTVSYNTSQWVTGSGLWSTASNWGFGVPNGAGAEATFSFPSSSPATTVTIDSAKTLGTLNFNSANYNLIGALLTLDRAAAPVTLNVSGLLQISANVNINKNAEINVNSGVLTLGGTVTAAAGVTYHKTGSGTLQMNNIRSAGLTIDGGTVAVFPTDAAPGVSKVTTLVINSGKLNLQANKLITATAAGTWTGSSYTGVTGMVVAGRGTSNLWDGASGIITQQPNAIGSNYTSIGVARASSVRPATATATDLWAGQTITGTDTLVMYTYGGDATLDGKINIDDYVKIDSGIAAELTGWSNGDFNYDGKVSIDDYITVIDANIGNQTGVFFTATGGTATAGPLTVVAVPEPLAASLIAIALPALVLIRRRRETQFRSTGSTVASQALNWMDPPA